MCAVATSLIEGVLFLEVPFAVCSTGILSEECTVLHSVNYEAATSTHLICARCLSVCETLRIPIPTASIDAAL